MNGITLTGKIGHYYTNKDLKKQYLNLGHYSKHKLTFRIWKKKRIIFSIYKQKRKIT